MIEVCGLTKLYGDFPAVTDLTFAVQPGEVMGLVGPNGAGKTTLLRIISTLMRPSYGQALVAGCALPGQASEARRRLGVISHHPLLYGDLTAEENLRFYARLYGLEYFENHLTAMLQQVGLQARRRDLVRTFSRGMQQRLAIARAILHSPEVLLCDEPYTGLDQSASAVLDQVLRDVAAHGRTVLMTTHDLAHGVALANRVLILYRGKIAFTASREEIDVARFPEIYAGVTQG